MKKQLLHFLALVLLALIGCKEVPMIGGEIDSQRLVDGIYPGFYKQGPVSVKVQITVEGQKLTKVELLKHDNGRGKKADSVIPNRIVEMQSTKVEAVTGATYSSRVMMNAVQEALEASYRKTD